MSKGFSGHFYNTEGYSNSLKRLIPGTPGVVTGGKSTVLGKNLLKEMGVSGNTKWSGYQAQHIIPVELKKHPVLQKIGMNLDDASNGIFLRVPGNNVSAQSRHRGYHSVYSEFVRLELNKINMNASSYTVQKKVLKLQSKLRYMQKSGLPLYSADGATVELWQRQYNKIKF